MLLPAVEAGYLSALLPGFARVLDRSSGASIDRRGEWELTLVSEHSPHGEVLVKGEKPAAVMQRAGCWDGSGA